MANLRPVFSRNTCILSIVRRSGTLASKTRPRPAIVPDPGIQAHFYEYLGRIWCRWALGSFILTALRVDCPPSGFLRVNCPPSGFLLFSWLSNISN